MQGCEAPTHCHSPIPPVLQPESLGCAHLADKCDFCRETNQLELVRGSLALLLAAMAMKGQSRVAASVRRQPRPSLPLPGSSWARRSFLRASSCTRPSRMSKIVSPWASSST